jgi:hypothetical protein
MNRSKSSRAKKIAAANATLPAHISLKLKEVSGLTAAPDFNSFENMGNNKEANMYPNMLQASNKRKALA